MKRKTVWFFALVILLFAEGYVLVQSRLYLPNGIAPAVLFRDPPGELASLSERHYLFQDPDVSVILKERAEADLGDISGLLKTEIAAILRDWTRHVAGCSGMGIISPDPLVILGSVDRGECASCKPLADLYIGFLRAYGIPARGIGLFESPGQFTGSHSTVEVWNGERWIIEDPTFNCIAVSDGDSLSVAEVQSVFASGGEVIWVQDRTETEPTIESYITPPEELYNTAIYSLENVPPDTPRWKWILIRFSGRLTGRVDAIVLTDEPFPLPAYMANGTIDKFLLVGCLICIVVLAVPSRTSGKR